jgi:hypothetical protein
MNAVAQPGGMRSTDMGGAPTARMRRKNMGGLRIGKHASRDGDRAERAKHTRVVAVVVVVAVLATETY